MPNDHLTPRKTPVAVGDAAPDFTLPDQDRNDWTLSEYVKQGPVVLCFYPMDFSGVCSTEMKCVTDEMDQFAAKGAEVVGISADSFFVHKAWAEHLGLKQTLLADMHRQVCRAYGFYFAGLNVASRGTVVVEAGGGGEGGGAVVKWVQARELKDAMESAEVLGAVG